jgi:two-component system, chemotaxis family, protein-glutamate methylesterase/glutaminase
MEKLALAQAEGTFMPPYPIIVIGASAGGVEALKQLVHELPANLPAAVFVVLHVPPHGTSLLPQILSRAGKLPAVHPKDRQAIQPGHIYIAPPDRHLLIHQGYMTLSLGPRENGHRPSADPLFRSAARAYGSRVIGVVLSGALDDGTVGLIAVKARAGISIVQDPSEAMHTGMPTSAIEHDHVDYILPVQEIASTLVYLAQNPPEAEDIQVMDTLEYETEIAEGKMDAIQDEGRPGTPAGLACPDCGGTLWEIEDDNILRFRCRVGHAYTAQSLVAEQNDGLEDALWVALRALQESASLARRLAERTTSQGHTRSAVYYEEKARTAEEHAKVIRDFLMGGHLRTGQNLDSLDTPAASTG